MRNNHDRVLSIYPTRTGFGWVLFEGPQYPVDWGVVAVAANRNAGCLARIEGLIDERRPSCLVLEQFEGPGSRREERIQSLCRDILNLAEAKGIEADVYSLSDIKARFEEIGATKRYEIATAIAARIEDFAHVLPPKRKIWNPEDPRMGLFNAAAVALTHYWLISAYN